MFITETNALRSVKFLEIILSAAVILNLRKLRQRDGSDLPKAIQLITLSRSQVYRFSFIPLFIHFSFTQFIHSVNTC